MSKEADAFRQPSVLVETPERPIHISLGDDNHDNV